MKTLKIIATVYALLVLTWIAFLLDDIRESVGDVETVRGGVNILDSALDPVPTRER
jgi:hypothetical protein